MIASLRFTGDLSPWAVLALGLTSALLVVWFYLKETRSLAFPYNNLLPALRGAAVAAVVFILSGPVWHKRDVIGTLGRVVFAVDTSESMGLTDSSDGGASGSRLQRAIRLLTGSDATPGWLETLSATHDVDVVQFSEGPPTLVWSSRDRELTGEKDWAAAALAEWTAEGHRTNLASGLAISPAASALADHVADQQATLTNRSAVVLMTDGRDNAGGAAAEAAAQLASRGVAVHAIGIGSTEEQPDVGVIDVERPESVASDGRLAGSVLLKTAGTEQQPLSLRIESGSKVVWQQTIDASADVEQHIPFELDVEPLVEAIASTAGRGVQHGSVVLDLRAVVESVQDDAAPQNNAQNFRVAATTRDRRLLVLDGSSRWETRYVRNLFERDPAWQVDLVLYGPGTDQPRLTRGEQPGQFPSSSEAISRYDAIILGEVPPDQFNQVDALHLREFVTRGGGLIVIDGQYDRLRELIEGPLSDLIPIRYTSASRISSIESIEPTPTGAAHTTLSLLGQPGDDSELWKVLPPPRSVASVAAQPGAEVWAQSIQESGGSTPWLVTRLFGAGRVFYLSSDQTWRWRYKVADRFHSRFWNQLLTAAMQPPYSVSDQYVSIGTDRVEYNSGERPTIRVMLRDAAGDPLGDATVDAVLWSNGEAVTTVPLAVDDAARGTYQATTPRLPDGHYEVRVQASGYGEAALAASTPIWIGSNDSLEYRKVSLDQESLNEIVGMAQGKYYHESEAGNLLKEIQPLSSGMIIESDVVVWQSFYWFWAVVVLLAIEWLLRKRAGLV